MNDTDKNARLPISNVTVRETLREMALDMSVALYRRYGRAAAAKVLGVPVEELDGLREQGRIGYLDISDDQASFFGCQLLTFLLESVVPPGEEARERLTPVSPPSKPAIKPEAELLSVKEAIAILGIGETKFHDLKNTGRLKTGKIDGRRVIKRSDLMEFIDNQFE